MARFLFPWQLRRLGILGMNGRNIGYISRYNARHRYPMVDNKLLTKKALARTGIATPRLLAHIDSPVQIHRLMDRLATLDDFVIKPACGSGGKGIVVIIGREGDHYIKASGSLVSSIDLRRHLSDILSGLYSLGGKPDEIMVEERVDFDPVLSDYSFEGVPDVRIIVFLGFPVMAMLRCSTRSSDGRANLHQGAVGVGIDLRTGGALRAVQRNRPLTTHPDTGRAFSDLVIPQWESLLHLAASCYEVTRLGYMGCDLVLDRRRGAQVLELNARPGLAIQTANGSGLRQRLEVVRRLPEEMLDWAPVNRVQFARERFGGSAPG